MVFNNSVNASQQGTQYVSSLGAWSGIDGGLATHVLTSNGTGVAPSFQANAAITYFSLTPYIVGSDIHSQYATISAAIAQAVADGASNTNQKNIYVKPGTYNENLTLSDGINVIGIDEIGSEYFFNFSGNGLSVSLTGSISISSGNSKVQNIYVNPATTVNCFNVSGGSLCLVGLNVLVTNATALNITANSNINISGGIWTGAGAFIFTTIAASLASCILNFSDTTIHFGLASNSTVGDGSTVLLNMQNSSFFINSIVGTGLNTSISLFANFCLMGSSAPIINAYKGSFSLNNCNCGGGFTYTNSPAQCSAHNSNISVSAISLAGSTNGIDIVACRDNSTGAFINYGANGAGSFSGSGAYTVQGSTQTLNAIAAPHLLISLATNQSVVITGTVIGQNAAFTDTTSAEIFATAHYDGITTSIIGAPIININASSIGNVTLTTSGNFLIIEVTGLALTTYNWRSNITYQGIIDQT